MGLSRSVMGLLYLLRGNSNCDVFFHNAIHTALVTSHVITCCQFKNLHPYPAYTLMTVLRTPRMILKFYIF